MNQYEKNYNDCEIIKFSKILIIVEETDKNNARGYDTWQL